MKDSDSEAFERELRRLRPAQPPAELRQHLEDLLPQREGVRHVQPLEPDRTGWRLLLRWLAPTAVAALLALAGWLLFEGKRQSGLPVAQPLPASPSSRNPDANQVEMDRQLVTDFDAVGRLATGERVRFQCREWREQLTLRNSQRNVVVEQTAPRVEILSVRFDTY